MRLKDFSLARKMFFLAAGVTGLLAAMILTVAHQSYSMFNQQVNSLGMELIKSRADEVDRYFDGIWGIVNTSAGTAQHLIESEGKTQDSDLEPSFGAIYDKVKADPNILDVYMGLESSGKLASGSHWEEPQDYDSRKRPWYEDVLKANGPVITEPYVDPDTKEVVITLAVPVKGKDGRMLGVVAADLMLKSLSETITSYTILGKGNGFLTTSQGTLVCDPNKDLIMKENITKASSMITPELAEAGRKMISGGLGFVDYKFQGEGRRTFYAPTKSGFILGVVFPSSELNAMVRSLAMRQLVMGIFTLVLVAGMLWGLSKSIVEPVRRITRALAKLGSLDLTRDPEEDWLKEAGRSNTEVGQMALSAVTLQEALRHAIGDIAQESDRAASAAENLAALSEEQVASVEEIKASIDQVASLMESNSAALQETNAGIEEVSSGAQQAANSATDGAEAASRMSVLSEQTVRQVEEVVKAIAGVGEESQRTFDRIQKVAESVSSISGFVNTIRSIADQTNLLALNAAIEAARAGEAGRGFAVVAEEVRKLAEESAMAAKEVEDLIAPLQANTEESLRATEQSKRSMEDTVRRAHEAMDRLSEVLDQIKVINDAMQNIAATSEEQAAAAQEIAQGIDNATQGTINVVNTVEVIRHSTEETARASEAVAQEAQTLSHTADKLKGLVSKFRYGEAGLSLGPGKL
ncbi:methyl-accepting chemotaxis protein [Thermanaerovibrio velox DSM 12556]|uniref:Methyl-accepting chemotaxis protein n=1 Tax=Thermanaerovibrio velox DSM 12556 TaxID=926567 RepID=H0UPF6_9BACT|nr:methyl-accepting chemotaxis protein [Thermanaerovibrio velox]EHM10587.1 methyl-accepting chemotaxis protein [Thermanaerovibrio velox DSM 12556]